MMMRLAKVTTGIAVLLGLTVPTGGLARQPVPKKSATPAATAAPSATADGPAWKVICPDVAAMPAQPCSLVQNLVAGEQKQRLLTVIVQPNAQSGHAMTVALPHGVLFPAGVTLQIDDAQPQSLVVQTSDQNGAYTGAPIDATMLAALKGGKSLKIGFTGTNGQKIIVPVTLKDFAPGLTELDNKPVPAAKKS